MYTGYLDTLGNIHDCKLIADIESSRPANEMKTTEKIGGNG